MDSNRNGLNMDFSIKTFENGDFEVCHFYNCNCSNCMDELERLIKESMEVPLEYPDNTDDLESHLPGICEADFAGIRTGEMYVISSGSGVGKSMISAAQPQQHQPNPPSEDEIVEDFMWAIVKLRDGKEYWLKKLNEDGTREWTQNNTQCRLWHRQSKAEEFIREHIGEGQAGVRGLLVGG